MTWTQRREAVFHVIDWLTQGGLAHYGTTFPDDPRGGNHHAVWHRANVRQSIMGKTEIEKFRSSTSIDFGDKVALIAPPNDRKSAVAVLHCRWRQDDGQRDCSLYYGLWESLVVQQVTGPPVSLIAFTGHRIEIPERGSNHNYYHSQYCKALGPNGTTPPPEALMLSSTHPAWPIAAADEVQLALCLVVALYGFTGFGEFESQTDESGRWRNHSVMKAARAEIRKLQQKR